MLWTFCWEALIFVWGSLNGHNDFIIRAAASAPLPTPIYASFKALGAKKLRFACGYSSALHHIWPVYSGHRDKVTFLPISLHAFWYTGHSDTSMYLIYEVSIKMAIWLTLNWLFQVSYDIEMEHIFKSEFSCPIFITVFLVANAVNAAARLRWS